MPRINDSFINRNGIRNRNCGKLFTHGSFSFSYFFLLFLTRFAVTKNRKYERNIVSIFMRPIGKTMWRYENRKTAYETHGNTKIHFQTRNWIIEFRDVVSNIYIWNIIKFSSIFLNSFFFILFFDCWNFFKRLKKKQLDN